MEIFLFYSAPVLRFFRFQNPPQPHESLDASQTYCEHLEQTVVELKHNCRELEDEIQSLKNELDSSVHHHEEARGLALHYEKQFSYQGSELQVCLEYKNLKLLTLPGLVGQLESCLHLVCGFGPCKWNLLFILVHTAS